VDERQRSVFNFSSFDEAYQLDDDRDDGDEAAMVLRREMSYLKSQAEKLRPRQEFATGKANFHLLQLGKISCRQICAALMAKLPREIRDLIYEYFNKHDNVHIYDITGTSSYWPSYALKTVQPRLDWPNITPDYPHYWDPEYTGHGMKSELVENWFRTASFKFAFKFSDIPAFITGKDTLGFGLSPGKLVSKVGFWFSHFDLKESWLNGMDNDNRHSSPRAKLLHDMDNLTILRKGVYITITIRDTEGWLRGRSLKFPEDYLDVIFPVLSRLKDAGHNVSVFLESDELLRKHRHIPEFNFKNAEFSVQGWVRRFEEVSFTPNGSLKMLMINSTY
jgi:hypothetical protein